MTPDGSRHLDDERCAELVLALLPEDVRRKALAHAAACEVCAARLRSHVAASVRAAGEWADASGLRSDGPASRAPRAGLQPPRAPRTAWLLLPAAAALVVVSLLLTRGPAPPRGEEGPWLPAPAEAVVPRGETPPDRHLAAGFEAYARRDLAAVERELAGVRAEGGAEQARRLYLAHARLARGDHASALELLRSVEFAELPLRVSREAAALYARALRAAGEGAEADSLERHLREAPEWVPVRP